MQSTIFLNHRVYLPRQGYLCACCSMAFKGVDINNFGIEIENYVKRTIPKQKFSAKDLIKGRISHIDKFGNLISNIKKPY